MIPVWIPVWKNKENNNNKKLFSSVAQSCLTLCNPMDCSTPGVSVHHQLPELAQTHSCLSRQWCHPTISSSVVPFSSCLQSFPASVFSSESVLCVRWPKKFGEWSGNLNQDQILNNMRELLFLLGAIIKCGFPWGSVSKESACNAGDSGSIPGSERSPGEGNGNLLHSSCLENPVNKGTWRTIVHGVTGVGHN